MEFKQLDIKTEESWVKRNLLTKQGKKTIIYTLAGTIAGIIIYMVTEEKKLAAITFSEIVPNLLIGGFFGFFITNSPCARNRC
jgi:Na+/pantothenate symporter